MTLLIGIAVIFGAVFGGYILNGGHLEVLWQPFEMMIIFGAALGAYFVANPGPVLKGILGMLPKTFKGPKYKKAHYVELLVMLNTVFKMAKSKGAMALEPHIENAKESTVFAQYPKFLHDHDALDFFCDFTRMLIMGADNPHEIESLMDARIDVHQHHQIEIAGSVQAMADAMPALGIVAAVLGVIHTMGSITEPPEVLGHLIGGALVGTFMGVWVSYCFLAPIATSLKAVAEDEIRYLICIKSGILAYMQGYAPIMAVESARMMLAHHLQPSFSETEKAIDAAPAA